jgi:hypothetical protein
MPGEKSPAEHALGRSYTAVDGVRFNVTRLSVEHHPDRTATFLFEFAVNRTGHPDECWTVTLPWDDTSFADVLTSSAPDQERLQQMVGMVHALLEEWWATKARNKQSAKMGRRIS